jgi:hypothetical protein
MPEHTGYHGLTADEELLRRSLALLEDVKSPLLQAVEKWAVDHCDKFEHVAARASSADPTAEMPLWSNEVHQQYTRFVESELEDTLRRTEHGGVAALLASARAHSNGLGEELARALDALCNFDVFVQMMEDARIGVALERNRRK